jgi:transcriptional regulator with XRE-family HTH domain
MATVRELRLEAGLSKQALGRRANVDAKTISRAEDGLPIQDVKAAAIVRALGEALGQKLTIEEVDNLHIYMES